MSLVSEEGILLRSFPYSETSRVMRFITPGHGLVSAMARGVRRESSKGRGAVETFDEVAIVLSYRESRDLHTLRELQVVRSRRRLGGHLLRFAGASLLAELLLAHTLQEESSGTYGAVRRALDRIEEVDPDRLPAEIVAAAWGILVQAGFPPELERCARCGGTLPDEGLLRFHAASGGLLCPRCGGEEGREGGRLGPGARASLRDLVSGEPVPGLKGAGVHLALLESFALHHLAPARGLRSTRLLRPLMDRTEEAGGPAATQPG